MKARERAKKKWWAEEFLVQYMKWYQYLYMQGCCKSRQREDILFVIPTGYIHWGDGQAECMGKWASELHDFIPSAPFYYGTTRHREGLHPFVVGVPPKRMHITKMERCRSRGCSALTSFLFRITGACDFTFYIDRICTDSLSKRIKKAH